MKRSELTALLRFLVVGVGNTLIGLSAIFVCLKLGAGDVAANAIGYAFGLVFSFIVNRKWTFRHTGAIWPTLARFGAVFALAYGANLLVTLAMLRVLGPGAFLAQVVGIVAYTVLFFLGSRLLVFKPA